MIAVLLLAGLGVAVTGALVGRRGASRGTAAVVVALALTVAGSVVLAVVPFGTTRRATVADGTEVVVETTRPSLVEQEGAGVLVLLAVPVAISGGALAAARSRHRRGIWLATGVVLLVLCVVAIFSVGLFYAPAALALVLAGALDRGPVPERTGGG